MLRGMKMFCGVFVLGRVTTSDMTAAQAQAQMHPAIAHLQTLFAAPGLRLHVLDLIEMRTVFRHASPAKSHCSLNWNSHLEPRISGNGLYADEPTHFLHDAMDYIQTEAGSFAHALSGKKRLKDA